MEGKEKVGLLPLEVIKPATVPFCSAADSLFPWEDDAEGTTTADDEPDTEAEKATGAALIGGPAR